MPLLSPVTKGARGPAEARALHAGQGRKLMQNLEELKEEEVGRDAGLAVAFGR